MAGTEHDITILNSLIATTLDSVAGYREAAEDIENDTFAGQFTSRAQERQAVARDLQAQVRSLGGNPEDDGTVLAGAHRVFVDLKSKITGQDAKAVVNEVERGEDHIKHKFEAALTDDKVSAATKDVIRQANVSVRAGHDQMSALKHSL